MGTKAEMLFYEKEPKKDKNHQPPYEEHNNVRRTGKEKKNCHQDCSGGKREDDDDVHLVEDYMPPKIDEQICRDPFCKLHKSRPIFHRYVSSRDSANHPHHTGGFFHGGSYIFHNRNHFHDYYYDPRMSQPGYGYYHGYDDSDCSIM
ncbi:hypothetical protein ACH5RR_010701 [Cinchona calisaya]|uniref:Uncharacterized protein n=1 Tax=Cinchona calisaya TaxID=153742 RepID=A0ABD3AJT0_9GENT